MSIIYVCDFCGKNDKEVEWLFAEKVTEDHECRCICSECVDIASGMLSEMREKKSDADQGL